MEQIHDYHQEEEEVSTIVESQDSGLDHTQSNSSDSDPTKNDEADSESDCESQSAESNYTDPFGVFTRNGMMVRLNDVSVEYDNIVKNFAFGMGTAAGDTEVVAVHKNSVSGLASRARLETFRVFKEAVGKKCGGDANIRYAWYIGSKDEIAEVLVHGFTSRNGDDCGRIELIPVKFALDGAMALAAGDDGLRHMLLCRVILGKMEVVTNDLKQVVPSSDEFDSGVDSVVNCRRHFVWSPFMNSHICPAYVVSFKGPASLKGYVITATNAPSVASPIITQGNAEVERIGMPGQVTFAGVVAGLTRFLTPKEMKMIVRLLDEFRAKKITGDELKQKARLVAGDNKLISALKLMSATVKGGGVQIENRSVRDIYLPDLITVLAELLPAPKTAMLTKSLAEFRAKKIDRVELARSVRVIVGNDDVLAAAINSYRIGKQRQQEKLPV